MLHKRDNLFYGYKNSVHTSWAAQPTVIADMLVNSPSTTESSLSKSQTQGSSNEDKDKHTES